MRLDVRPRPAPGRSSTLTLSRSRNLILDPDVGFGILAVREFSAQTFSDARLGMAESLTRLRPYPSPMVSQDRMVRADSLCLFEQ